jgi:uncharacterized membrane protein YidH (DUF202 family)
MHEPPFDPGLQPERTLLAWRRSALALGLTGVVGARLATPYLGVVAVVLGVVGAGLALLAYLAASARYRRVHHSLTRAGALDAGGIPVALLALACALVGVGAGAFVLLLALT